MSKWNHVICVPCWQERNPGKAPYTIKFDVDSHTTCCFCSKETRDGIYVRHDPNEVACLGDHGGDDE